MAETLPKVQAPQSGYYFARLYAIDKRLWGQSVKNVTERLKEHAKVYEKAYRDSLGLLLPPPKERLDFLIMRTPAEWASLQLEFPEVYEKEMADFRKLTERAQAGELEDE